MYAHPVTLFAGWMGRMKALSGQKCNVEKSGTVTRPFRISSHLRRLCLIFQFPADWIFRQWRTAERALFLR
jgi:hypothetical protein